VLQAAERDAPSNVEPIDWKLITNLPVRSRAEAIEKLDWYLARASDPPPGNTVIWRGMARLTDIELGFTLAAGSCG